MSNEFEQNDKAIGELPELPSSEQSESQSEPEAPPRRQRHFPLWMAGLALVLVGSMLGSAMTWAMVSKTRTAEAAPEQMSPSPPVVAAAGLPETQNVIPAIYKRVAPSVVSVTVTSRTVVRGLFGEQFEQQQQGDGSGFIVDANGFILTNHHVIQGATNIRVRLHDGTELDGTVIGSDPSNDLAVVKVDPKGAELKPLPLGDSDATDIGDLAIAIGYPFRLPQSVTAGIISGKEREMEGTSLRNLLQTDAAVNPGNSGGPLVNGRGEVIGVNTAIESPVRGFVGIGFAVPINIAKSILPQLKEGKTIQHPWLGVYIETVTEAMAKQYSLPVSAGVLVSLVAEGSPAEKAGLKSAAVTRRQEIVSADIVTHVNGKALSRADDLIREIGKHSVGDKVELTVRRGEETLTLTATLEARPEQTNR